MFWIIRDLLTEGEYSYINIGKLLSKGFRHECFCMNVSDTKMFKKYLRTIFDFMTSMEGLTIKGENPHYSTVLISC